MTAATDIRHSRLVLLRSIARRIVPQMLENKVDVVLKDEALRPIDRDFSSWPARYPTPSMVWYDPPNEDNSEVVGEDGTISFHWSAGCDVLNHDDIVYFDVVTLESGEASIEAQDLSDMELLEQVDALGFTSPTSGAVFGETSRQQESEVSAAPNKKRRAEQAVKANSVLTALEPPSIVPEEGMNIDDVITVIARHLARWVDGNDAELRKSKDLCYKFTREQMAIIDDVFLHSGPVRWSPPSAIEWHSTHEDDRDGDDKDRDLTHGDLHFFWNSPACGGRRCATSADVSVWAELDENDDTMLHVDVRVGYW